MVLRRRGVKGSLLLGLVLVAAAAAVSLLGTGSARGAPSAAAMDVTQTCSQRVAPGARIDVQGEVVNSGDVIFQVTFIGGDAGTPNDQSDDFTPAFTGGDTNGNNLVDPGEHWTYAGFYTAPTEDVTDIVSAEGVATGGVDVNDLAPCQTDVIQQPEPGTIVGAKAVSGRVLVKVPGTDKFVELDGQTEIPVGSQVDTTQGVIRLTAGLGGGKTNSGDFWNGLFTIAQSHTRNAFLILKLGGGDFAVCRHSYRALGLDAKRRPVRRLWGSGKGRFTSKGRYSSATVRGTKWLVQDQCNGTLTRVAHGRVLVRDFRRHKNVIVTTGHSYLAKP